VEDLVETLVTGFLVSGLFIVIVWWFWRRYDRPCDVQLAREEELAKKSQEQQMWRAVEAQMAEERAQSEEQALYMRKKAEEHQRAQPPAAGALSNALDAFGGPEPATQASSVEAVVAFAGSSAAPVDDVELGKAEPDAPLDLDLLLAKSPVEVRQDKGVLPGAFEAVEPDWTLVEKLDQLAKTEVVVAHPHPELPEAPDLEALSNQEAETQSDAEDAVEWGSNSESLADDAWNVEWTTAPDEEE
jgi:hypothetical protein